MLTKLAHLIPLPVSNFITRLCEVALLAAFVGWVLAVLFP